MKSITSRDNPFYKELKNLATSAQTRRKAGLTMLDGVHLCQAYWQQRGRPATCIVAEGSVVHPEVGPLLDACLAAGVRCISLPDALYHAISQVENGIGLCFVVDTPRPQLPGDLRESAVALDNLQDPGNLGSILRSAAAAGIRHVLCSAGCAAAWSPKVMRAAMGGHFLLNIYENVDLHACLSKLTIPVLATSSHTSRTIYQTDLKPALVWLFGHEGQGVSAQLMDLATDTCTIPQCPGIESLNVAASAAICFFEQRRQSLAQ